MAVGDQTSSPEPSSNTAVQEKQNCALKRQRGCQKVDHEATDAYDKDEDEIVDVMKKRGTKLSNAARHKKHVHTSQEKREMVDPTCLARNKSSDAKVSAHSTLAQKLVAKSTSTALKGKGSPPQPTVANVPATNTRRHAMQTRASQRKLQGGLEQNSNTTKLSSSKCKGDDVKKGSLKTRDPNVVEEKTTSLEASTTDLNLKRKTETPVDSNSTSTTSTSLKRKQLKVMSNSDFSTTRQTHASQKNQRLLKQESKPTRLTRSSRNKEGSLEANQSVAHASCKKKDVKEKTTGLEQTSASTTDSNLNKISEEVDALDSSVASNRVKSRDRVQRKLVSNPDPNGRHTRTFQQNKGGLDHNLKYAEVSRSSKTDGCNVKSDFSNQETVQLSRILGKNGGDLKEAHNTKRKAKAGICVKSVTESAEIDATNSNNVHQRRISKSELRSEEVDANTVRLSSSSPGALSELDDDLEGIVEGKIQCHIPTLAAIGH